MLEKTLESPWIARRSNQSNVKETNTEYSLEGLMLKLKLQYFGYLMQRADSLEKTLMLGKIEGRRRREMVGWHHWLNVHEFEQTLGDTEGQDNLSCVLQYMRSQRVRHDLVTEQQQCLLIRWPRTLKSLFLVHSLYLCQAAQALKWKLTVSDSHCSFGVSDLLMM